MQSHLEIQLGVLNINCNSDVYKCIITEVDALRINKIEAPNQAFTGDTVTLRCEYDVEGGKLHSVKWYHNNLQFYWYRELDGSWAFPEKDMTVDVSPNIKAFS